MAARQPQPARFVRHEYTRAEAKAEAIAAPYPAPRWAGRR